MRDLYRIKPFSMLAWWVACSFFVWPLIVIVLGVVAMPVVYLASIISPYGVNSTATGIILACATIIGIGAIIGLCMAFLQRWVLRTKLYWTADRWYLWTAIGGAVGASVIAPILIFFLPGYSSTGEEVFYMMPVFLGIVSAFQFLALRNAVKQAWFWVIANIVGGMVYAGVLIGNQPSYTNDYYALTALAIGSLSVASIGFISGFVLLFLFEKKLLPLQAEDAVDIADNSPNSIWDKAI